MEHASSVARSPVHAFVTPKRVDPTGETESAREKAHVRRESLREGRKRVSQGRLNVLKSRRGATVGAAKVFGRDETRVGPSRLAAPNCDSGIERAAAIDRASKSKQRFRETTLGALFEEPQLIGTRQGAQVL